MKRSGVVGGAVAICSAWAEKHQMGKIHLSKEPIIFPDLAPVIASTPFHLDQQSKGFATRKYASDIDIWTRPRGRRSASGSSRRLRRSRAARGRLLFTELRHQEAKTGYAFCRERLKTKSQRSMRSAGKNTHRYRGCDRRLFKVSVDTGVNNLKIPNIRFFFRISGGIHKCPSKK